MDSKKKNSERLSNLVESLYENLGDIFGDDHLGQMDHEPGYHPDAYYLDDYGPEAPDKDDYATRYPFDKQKYETAIAEAILKLVESDRKVIVKMLIDNL